MELSHHHGNLMCYGYTVLWEHTINTDTCEDSLGPEGYG